MKIKNINIVKVEKIHEGYKTKKNFYYILEKITTNDINSDNIKMIYMKNGELFFKEVDGYEFKYKVIKIVRIL